MGDSCKAIYTGGRTPQQAATVWPDKPNDEFVWAQLHEQPAPWNRPGWFLFHHFTTPDGAAFPSTQGKARQ